MIQYMQKLINKLKASEKGQGMVEYALIIAFVAAIAIFALNGGLRTAVSSAFDNATNNVNQANSGIQEITGQSSGGTGGTNGGGNGGG